MRHMQLLEQNLFDKTRNRQVPILIYTPNNSKESLPVVIFNPGYQEKKNLTKSDNDYCL